MVGKKGKKQQTHTTQQGERNIATEEYKETIRGRNRERHSRKTEVENFRLPCSNKRKKHGN
jgi:hypothetical protein